MTNEHVQNLTIIDPQLIALAKHKSPKVQQQKSINWHKSFADKTKIGHRDQNLNMRIFHF